MKNIVSLFNKLMKMIAGNNCLDDGFPEELIF
jgi:hypothetical protein